MNPNHCQIKKHNMPIFISFTEVGGGGGGLADEKPIEAAVKTATTTSYSGDIVNHYTYQGRKLGKKVYNSQHTLTVDEEYYDELMFNFGKPSRISHADGYLTLSRNGSVAEVYYYLKDHLGNVRSVITHYNDTPVVVQTNDYFPFGMSLSNAISHSDNPNKHKYNGKEEQEMPGKWLDYGQRMYDPQLGRFHVIDRFTEKYYSMTPYQYGANNPILYIDINGDSIWITNRTGFLGLRSEKLLYENGTLYNGGQVHEGKQSKFTRNTVNALDKIRTGGAKGEALVTGLQESPLNLTISRTYEGNRFVGKGREMSILWNPSSTLGGPNDQGNNSRPAFIGLSHELGHAEDWANASYNSNEWLKLSNEGIISNAEKHAMHVENMIRAEHGLALRTHYAQDLGRLVAPALIPGTRFSSNNISFSIPAIPNFLPLPISIPYEY
jgi:RHS repeat-associated protein